MMVALLQVVKSYMPNTPKDEFAARLRHARETLRKLTQVELARRAGLPSTAISHFEAGARKPSFDSLRRLATALDVTTDWLLGQVDDPDQSAAADPLYRHIQNLSAADRDNARKIIEALSDKPKPPDKE